MSATQETNPPVLLQIPPIALNSLKESTKDFMLTEANDGKTPVETIRDLLDRGAERAGYLPKPAEPEAQTPEAP